jgi:hypothetical protein
MKQPSEWQMKFFLVDRSIKDEAALVDDPRRARRVFYWMLVWLVVGFGVIFVLAPRTNSVLSLLAVLACSAMVGRSTLITLRRMQAYRNGWIEGRIGLLNSMREAERRGMSLEEWEQLEAERVARVMSR